MLPMTFQINKVTVYHTTAEAEDFENMYLDYKPDSRVNWILSTISYKTD